MTARHAVTLHQPWATCVAHHGKRLENRGRRPPPRLIGHPVAIHAGRKFDDTAYQALRSQGHDLPPRAELPRGRIVAVAILAGWIDGQGQVKEHDQLQWWAGPIAWVLRGVIALPEPVACRGSQGWWVVPADAAGAVRAQLRKPAGRA